MARKKLNRDKLIEKATELFTKRGYHHTSMNDVAEICQVKKGSLYHHIPSRKALMIAVVDRVVTDLKRECFSLAYDEQYSASSRLSHMLNKIEESSADGKCRFLLISLMLETVKEIPEVIPIVKSYFNDWVAAIAHLLVSHYGPMKAKEHAEDAVLHLHGSIILGNLFNDLKVIKCAIHRVANLLLPD